MCDGQGRVRTSLPKRLFDFPLVHVGQIGVGRSDNVGTSEECPVVRDNLWEGGPRLTPRTHYPHIIPVDFVSQWHTAPLRTLRYPPVGIANVETSVQKVRVSLA